MSEDTRLIEDYLPIEAISAEASREKSLRKGHISTLHLWWARRPLVACRAAVYGALVPADRWVKDIELKNPPADAAKAEALKNGAKRGLNRGAAAKFVKRLCRYPTDSKPDEKADIERAVEEAQQHILEAHAERLTRETGRPVTVDDIEAGRAPRPKVLDMFAGGGSIPLEALRLGCEAYALELNPVAHVIELCTLVYPQKYGKPDPTARGMTGPTNEQGETTWGGLANEVRYWGDWVLKKVKAEIGDLYPLIPDPARKKRRQADKDIFGKTGETPAGYLVPIAYLWTRTVTCKNPACKAVVPLVRQTWLCKKKGRYVALKVTAERNRERQPPDQKRVRFQVIERDTEKALGFDPAGFSKGGNATCPFCGTVANNDYVKAEGKAGRIGTQAMAVVCTRPRKKGSRKKGKIYIAADSLPADLLPYDDTIRRRIGELCHRTGLTVPDEPINPLRPSPNARGLSAVTRHGLHRFGDLFTARQMLCLLTFVAAVRKAHQQMSAGPRRSTSDHAHALVSYLAVLADRLADYCGTLCLWEAGSEFIKSTFARQALPMTWDYAEQAPFGGGSGSPHNAIKWVTGAIESAAEVDSPSVVSRGSSTAQPWAQGTFDAVITDPPYYDNVPYSDVSDFFYVWLKRTVGHLYGEHFATALAPKKSEVTALASRHAADMSRARSDYEGMMAQSLAEASRVLKPGGTLAIVYAHKTTLGWATLVHALRRAGFSITEAWPLDTERKVRLLAMDSAALASSIFLVGRKREATASTGNYEDDVQPELAQIVRERVETLWDQGISGADLVIACVGAGLQAFTRYQRVEYANGEEVQAKRFLTEVETVVLDTILGKLSSQAQLESPLQAEPAKAGTPTTLSGVDPATRFYTLWRYTYRSAELDAGEAIIFANGTHVELDGPSGLSSGARALVVKKKGKYRLRDYTERGEDENLGVSGEGVQPAPLIDALHRTLWLMERHPGELGEFLRQADPNREQMRLVAQALAGPALKGSELADISPSTELSALAKLTANWRSVIEDNVFTPSEVTDRKRGQRGLFK
jgi:putative DNA methylase